MKASVKTEYQNKVTDLIYKYSHLDSGSPLFWLARIVVSAPMGLVISQISLISFPTN